MTIKKILRRTFLFFARRKLQKLLRKNQTQIFGITGSVGKTTAKKFAAAVLSARADEKSFNTPVGFFLNFFDEKEIPRGTLNWCKFFARILKTKKLPPRIVLEFGADRPGDLNSLLKIARPDFAAITKIAPTHLHNFKTVENVAAEKVKLARAAKFFSILNFDDRELFGENLPAGIKFFGREKSCDLQISEIHETPTGFEFKLSGKFAEKNFTQKFTANFFGAFQISAFLPGIFFGLSIGISPEKIAEKFSEFVPPPGRGKILTGKNSTKIWDHSFNSSPAAARAVLQTLPQIPAARRIALLGEMKELGNSAEKFHREIARLAAGNCDFVVFVGTENFAEEFKNEIPPEKFHAEKTAENAGNFLSKFIRPRDLILTKGSRSIRLEKAIAPLLENKNDAKKLAGEI